MKLQSPPKLFRGACVTDLDGTLLPRNGSISQQDLHTLKSLKSKGIYSILATGRSLYSLQKVIPEDAVFDYVIFATGAGIIDWQNKELLYVKNLAGGEIKQIADILEEYKIDYMLHKAIPDTHMLHYRRCGDHPDFMNRIDLYQDYAESLDIEDLDSWQEATQFLAIVEPTREYLYEALCHRLEPLRPIRTTSPLDLSSLWIEIFAEGVSKGEGLLHLLDLINLSLEDTMVIGNDFNDLHMLKICPNAFVTANAPQELKEMFPAVASCEDSGFSEAVELWLQNLQKTTD